MSDSDNDQLCPDYKVLLASNPMYKGTKFLAAASMEDEHGIIKASLDALHSTISLPRIALRKKLSVATYDHSTHRVTVESVRGDWSHSIGQHASSQFCLLPEETLFLVERGVLELFEINTPRLPKPLSSDQSIDFNQPLLVSLQRARQLLVRSPEVSRKFQVYSHLKRLGFIVRPFVPSPAHKFSDTALPAIPKNHLRRTLLKILRALALYLPRLVVKVVKVVFRFLLQSHFPPSIKSSTPPSAIHPKPLLDPHTITTSDKIFEAIDVVPYASLNVTSPSYKSIGKPKRNARRHIALYTYIPNPPSHLPTHLPSSTATPVYDVYAPSTPFKKTSPPKLPSFRLAIASSESLVCPLDMYQLSHGHCDQVALKMAIVSPAGQPIFISLNRVEHVL